MGAFETVIASQSAVEPPARPPAQSPAQVNCILWQDNNRVLGITTAYNPTDSIIRARKRPSSTSTNASITRPVFGFSLVKDLPIPIAINVYNYCIIWVVLI